MLGSGSIARSPADIVTVAQVSDTQVDVFSDLYTAFVVTGTVVGIVVISYILYNAYKYRTAESDVEGGYDIDKEPVEGDGEQEVTRPELGVLPSQASTKSGKKLFLSFGISAIIVIALVLFAYWNLLLVEGMDDDVEAAIEGDVDYDAAETETLLIEVHAEQFAFDYVYPSGETFGSELVVPKDRLVVLAVTSCPPGECDQDVMHTWGSPEFRAKTDAMPGEYTTTWIVGTEVGEYSAICYELCGAGHSAMRNDDEIRVKPEDEFKDWCLENDCMAEDELTDFLEATGGEA